MRLRATRRMRNWRVAPRSTSPYAAGMSDDAAFEAPVIDRRLDLDLSPDEAADLVTTAAGWRTWLVDEADATLDVEGTAIGTVVDDGVERAVRIHERTERSITFTWWERDDPDAASEVVIRVHPTDTGSRIVITERPLAARASAASASASAGLVRWQVRACLLAMRTTFAVA